MQIGQNKVVTVTYKLHSSKAGEEKVFVEETGTENPLVFLYGVGMMIPGFESNLINKALGDDFDFSIDAMDAYGPADDANLLDMPIDMFKIDGVVDLELLRIGNMLPLQDNEGNRMTAKVVSVDGETVKLDFNHPLAGHSLHFSGSVVGVREATEGELDHGHVH